MIYLRLSTASQEVALGQALSPTDADTEVSTGTIANTDIKIWKAGATTLASKNSGGGTYISNGVWYCVLDATDTNTLGSGIIFVHVSGKLAMEREFCVLPAVWYDALFAATGNIPVDVATMQTDSLSAAALKADAATEIGVAVGTRLQAEYGTAQAGAAGTITLASTASAVDSYYSGRNAIVYIRQGTGAGQERPITAYVGASKVATIAPNWVTNPDSTSKYIIVFS